MGRGAQAAGRLLGEEVDEALRVGAGVLQHDVVEPRIDVLLHVLHVALDVGADGEVEPSLLEGVPGRWLPAWPRPRQASTTQTELPSGSRSENITGTPGMRMGSGSTSTPRSLSRLCSARASGASTPMEPPPGLPPIGGLSASRADDPGGATSTQRFSPFSPKRMSLRTSYPSLPV